MQTCPTLTPDVKCIRLVEYHQGRYIERFHKHVPKHKLAQKSHWILLRSLVLRYEMADAGQIVDAYLTRRGRAAKRRHRLSIDVDYPERGVIRHYCGTDMCAWIDTVLRSDWFRQLPEAHVGTATPEI